MLGGIRIDDSIESLCDGFILDHQTAQVSKLVSTELSIQCVGNTCHVSSDGTINAVIMDNDQNVQLVQISKNCQHGRITENYGKIT